MNTRAIKTFYVPKTFLKFCRKKSIEPYILRFYYTDINNFYLFYYYTNFLKPNVHIIIHDLYVSLLTLYLI